MAGALRGPTALAVACLLVLGVACSGTPSGGDTSDVVAGVPFERGERLVYELRDGDGEPLGTGTLSVLEAPDGLELVQAFDGLPEPGGAIATDTSRVIVDAATLKPRRMERVIDAPAEKATYEGVYDLSGEEPTLEVRSMRDGSEQERALELRAHAYENESSLWLWRTLAFAEDYEARYVSVNVREHRQQTAELAITGRETVTVPAGTFEAWRLQIRNGRATRVAWINVEAPHQVVQWDNGSTVFRLSEIGRVAP